jgi:predicted component of type VI protein secretion system
MDDFPRPAEDACPPYQGPHRSFAEGSPEAPVALKLRLLPAGPTVEMRQPRQMLGRHRDCDVRLALPDVSRRHCRFEFVDGSWHVMDHDSLNGLFVNGHKVPRARLCHGDQIRVGSVTLEVDLPGTPATLPLPPAPGSAKVLRSIANALPQAPEGAPEKRRAS